MHILLRMRGAAHTLYCDPVNELDALPLDEIIQKSGFTCKEVLVWVSMGRTMKLGWSVAISLLRSTPIIQ